MHIFRAALATAIFEFNRSLTPGRLAASAVLVLFPPAMTLLIYLTNDAFQEIEIVVAVTVFMVVVLSMLLWASPVVYAELEGKTWIYLASRPGGRVSTVLGKYTIAVIWSFAVAWLSMTMCMAIILYLSGDQNQVFKYWSVFTLLIGLGCIAYGSVFVWLGAMFHRRGMVFCAGYALISEVVIANLPAVISRFTIRFHLFNLGIDLLNPQWARNDEFQATFAPQPIWLAFLMLFAITAVALTATFFTVRMREYLTADEA